MDNGKTAYRVIQGILAAALVAAAVCLYQWVELYELRTTGKLPGCTINTTIDCATIWNSPLSTAIHQITGIPFPGWGLVWSVALIGLAAPLLVSPSPKTRSNRAAALRLITGTGTAVCVALAGYSVALGIVCPTCVAFYISVAVAAYLTFRYVRVEQLDWTMGAIHGAGWVVVPLLIMIYPGQQTPQSMTSLATLPQIQSPASPPSNATPAPPAVQGNELAGFVNGLNPPAKQALSDTLNAYRQAKVVQRDADSARVTFGKVQEGVHVVEWVDIKCPHCRSLFSALQEIRRVTHPGSWFLESRNFPLDGNCNPGITQKQQDDVRCVAARVLICLAGSPNEHSIRQKLFDAQADLTNSKVWEIADADSQQKSELQNCVSNPNTAEQLSSDLDYANAHGIEGTPMVVINGRKTPAWPPLILALILANGNADHPEFANLPPPNPLPSGG